jgi:hypothetical protein
MLAFYPEPTQFPPYTYLHDPFRGAITIISCASKQVVGYPAKNTLQRTTLVPTLLPHTSTSYILPGAAKQALMLAPYWPQAPNFARF